MEHKGYQLKSCVWEITLACCFSCRYCGSRAGKARENELSTRECLNVARQLADLGCRKAALIGGEVFMRPDWDLIAKTLSNYGIRVSIITNGYLFTEKLIGRIKDAGVEAVAVSVDGTEEIHDTYRSPGSFRRAMDSIRVLHESNIPVSVITTLNGRNINCLEALYGLLKDSGIYAWQLQACSPMGNASADDFPYQFDFGTVIRFVMDKLGRTPFPVGVADNIGYFTPGEGSLRGNPSGKAIFRGCGAGLDNIGIDSIGNVRGCEAMYDEAFFEGNLREKTLKEIWNDPEAFAYNRKFRPDMLTGKCGRCEYGRICAGGCRSYNFFAHGKLYESPYCAKGKI